MELLLEEVADHPHALSSDDIKRVRTDGAVRLALEREQPDLGTVPMGHDNLVVSSDLGDRRGRHCGISPLAIDLGTLVATQQRVASQRHDHDHRVLRAKDSCIGRSGSSGATARGPPPAATLTRTLGIAPEETGSVSVPTRRDRKPGKGSRHHPHVQMLYRPGTSGTGPKVL